jgi:hypothetical protein
MLDEQLMVCFQGGEVGGTRLAKLGGVNGKTGTKGVEGVTEAFEEQGLHGFLFEVDCLFDMRFQGNMKGIDGGVNIRLNTCMLICIGLQNTGSSTKLEFKSGGMG